MSLREHFSLEAFQHCSELVSDQANDREWVESAVSGYKNR